MFWAGSHIKVFGGRKLLNFLKWLAGDFDNIQNNYFPGIFFSLKGEKVIVSVRNHEQDEPFVGKLLTPIHLKIQLKKRYSTAKAVEKPIYKFHYEFQ